MFTSCILLHLFPTHFQLLLVMVVASPYFSYNLHKTGKELGFFFRKEQKQAINNRIRQGTPAQI